MNPAQKRQLMDNPDFEKELIKRAPEARPLFQAAEKIGLAARQAIANYVQGEMMPRKAASGLYANIHAKRARIAAGSGEKMRAPGSKGSPTDKAFRVSKRTAKKGKSK